MSRSGTNREAVHFEIVAGIDDDGQIFGRHRMRETDEQLRCSRLRRRARRSPSVARPGIVRLFENDSIAAECFGSM